MDVLTIEAVEQAPLPAGALCGGALEAPCVGDASETYAFGVRGWAAAREQAISGFQVLDGERLVAEAAPEATAPAGQASPAGEEHPDAVRFAVSVRAIELPPSFEVEVITLLEGGGRQSLGTIRGCRSRISVPRTAALSPAMITTIGRSGSKWLAFLLSCHPEMIAFQPLVFEPRVTTYWTTVMRSLTGARSYLRQIHTERWEEPRWWLGDGAGPLPAPVELGIAEWLGREAVHELAALCRQRTEAFYLEVARRSGKEGARYFVEKFLLDPVLLDLTHECFPDAREVILVRDFRDRLSSVFAWNERRGDHGFGHEAEMSKADYLTQRVRHDAQALLDRWRRRGEAAHLLRYEDLITDPHTTLSALFAHLGVAADRDAVEEVLRVATQPTRLLDNHRTVSDPSQSIGRWRRDLPPAFAEQADAVLAPVLAAFGY